MREPEPLAAPTASRVSLTLAIGAVGGGLFALINFPLAWLLGAMIIVTIATLSGAQLAVWGPLRTVMLAVLGLMLGSSFGPEFIAGAGRFAPALATMAVFVLAVSGLGYVILRKFGGYDPITSYFSAAPGGLSEMALMGEEQGADMRIISLVHATRILVVVATIPVWFRYIEGLDVPALPDAGTTLMTVEWLDGLLLLGCIVIGVPVGQKIKLPAAALTGPMILSAVAHAIGLIQQAPPAEIIAVAQVVVGAAIGCRFVGLDLKAVWTTILLAAGTALVYVAAATAAGFASAPLIGIPVEPMILSLAPGGLAEMTLIALTIGIETAFVSAMHVVRITMIVFIVPVAFKALKERLVPG